MTDTRPDGNAPERAEGRGPGREARYRGFHDSSAHEQPPDAAGGPPGDPQPGDARSGGSRSGGLPPLPRRDTSGAGGRSGPGAGSGAGAGSGTRQRFGAEPGQGPGGYGAGAGGGSGTYEPGTYEPGTGAGGRGTRRGGYGPGPGGYGAGAGGRDPLEQGHLPEYAQRNPLRGDPLPPPRGTEPGPPSGAQPGTQPGPPSEHHAQAPYGQMSQGRFTQQRPSQAQTPQTQTPQSPYPQPHIPRQEPASVEGPRPRPLEPRPESPTSAVSRWFRPHTPPDAREANAVPTDHPRPADPARGTPRNDPPAHPNGHRPDAYAPAPDHTAAPAPAPHPDPYAPSAYPPRAAPPADPAAIVPQEGTSARYPMSSYGADPQPSPYAEAPEAAAYGQTTPAYDQQPPASYDPQLLGYDQAPADPLGAPHPAATGDPLTDPLPGPLGPAAAQAPPATPGGDPLTDPLTDPLPGAAPQPAPRRHAGRPAVEEQQPYPAPNHGRHAGGATSAGSPPGAHRDPSPWGDLSAAAHAGAPGTSAPADPAQTQAQAHAPAPAPAPADTPHPGPAPAAPGRPTPRTPDQGTNTAADQRLTWGTAPAARRRGISAGEGRGDREDRTVQTMSLNVARALGTRMSARKAARAAKQQRTVLISRITGETFITLGVLMLLFVVYQLWWTNVLADRESRQEAKQLEEQWERGDGAGKADARDPGAFEAGEGFAIMHIPSLDVNRPVAQGIDKQKVLDRGLLGHYAEGDLKTAMPWDKKGNFAVAGHRNTHGEPFRYINKLEEGEEIIVETKDTYYIYEVASTLPSTSPSNTGVIGPVPEGSGFTEPGRYVTLTTCTPEYTSKYRLIVWGKMIEERPRSKGKPDALMD
ncbi:class E sortase [Streptomyces sp. 184]|uniref:class E sortase n=1 Tax=Streptomyces sp. 184 TaxID=1827526 RepID=UPI0038921B6E